MAKKTGRKSSAKKFLPVSAGGDPVIGEDQPFAGIGMGGVTQDRRISDVSQARELFVQLDYENQYRASSLAQVRNQIEGGRPFDPSELERAGESFRANVNFNDARAMFQRAALPYWKMLNEVPRKMSITLHSQSPHAPMWAITMAEVADMFFDDWSNGYYMQFSGWTEDLVLGGDGHVMWPDGQTPRYTWARASQLRFPKRTKADVDCWELVGLKRDMTVDELVEHVRDDGNRAGSNTAGWNTEAIYKAIKMAQPGPSTTRGFDPIYWQDMIVNNDLVIGGVWTPISVVDLWAKSHDGKSIRHYIFTERADVQEYLYEADEEAESFRQLFGPVFCGVGSNGMIHSIKGFGVRNYYYATTINRMKCRMVDSTTLALAMNFVKGDDTPDEAPPVQNYSMINLFPQGMTQLELRSNLSDVLPVMESLRRNQDENNFQYNEIKNSIENTDTATQGKLIAAIGSEMGTAIASITLSQVASNHYTEIMRRLCKNGSSDPDAIKFQKRCKERGVPDDALFTIERTVKTGVNPMMSDPAQRTQIMTQVRALLYNVPGANKRWIDETTAADLLGAAGAKNALLPEGAASDPAARKMATLEDGTLAQGTPLDAAPEEDHVAHLDTHLKPLEAMVQATQQGQQISPDHLVFFETAAPHIAQHLQYLQSDETKMKEFKELNARVSNVTSVMRGVMTRIARAHDRNQQQLAAGNPGDPEAVRTAMRPPPA